MLTSTEAAQITGAAGAAPSGTTKPKTGFDMPERAMKEYITQLAHKDTKPDVLRANFAAPIGSAASESGPKDLTGLAGTLNLTLMQGGVFNPNDRIERAMIEIRPLNAAIRSSTAARTEFDQIVEGTLGSSQSENAELSASPAAALGLPLTGTAKVGASNSQTQSITVSRRVENTTPIVDYKENTLAIVREGGAFRSLTGNTQVGLTLGIEKNTALRNFYSVKAFERDKVPIAPGDLDVTRQSVLVANLTGDLIADVKLTYVVRHVLDGGGTSPERDDNVRFITFVDRKNEAVLIPSARITAFQPGLTAPNYMIVVTDSTGTGTALSVRGGVEIGANTEILCFSDYQNAINYARYLKRMSGDLSVFGAHQVGIAGDESFTPFSNAMKPHLRVDTDCYPKRIFPDLKLERLESLKNALPL